MERHICVWHREADSTQSEAGELLIGENKIEFYSRINRLFGLQTLIGCDGNDSYKVFVRGFNQTRQKGVLENALSHRVFYAIKKNGFFSNEKEFSGISEFTFTFPELVKWIGLNTVYYAFTDDEEQAAIEYKIPSITIHKENPFVELYFESKTPESLLDDDFMSITVCKIPKIRVRYSVSVNMDTVRDYIECLMQFFGLLIGKVSFAEDIMITDSESDVRGYLYVNNDFSYNMLNYLYNDRPRTYCHVVENQICDLFTRWHEFYYDDNYALIRRIFFSMNSQRLYYAEEIFVEYMKFLDGFHTRAFGDAQKQSDLKRVLKKTTKIIKKRLFNEEDKPIFEKEIQSVIPGWRYKSDTVEDIAGWIANGYIARKPLSRRLKEIDDHFFGIIKNNAVEIEKESDDQQKLENLDKNKIIELYYKELGDTRNYFSHYKQDKSGVLNLQQLSDSIDVLKAVIISIFLSCMGIEKETIQIMLGFDAELRPKTDFLVGPDDQPFSHPNEIHSKSPLCL